jgi:hypothetical protein
MAAQMVAVKVVKLAALKTEQKAEQLDALKVVN